MSLHAVEVAVLWSTLTALAYIGWKDVIIPDVLTLPAAFLGIALNYTREPGNFPLIGAGVLVGCLLPLLVDGALGLRRARVRLGAGVMKGGGMLGAFLGWQLVLVALGIAGLLCVLLLRRMRVVPLGVPLAVGGWVASFFW